MSGGRENGNGGSGGAPSDLRDLFLAGGQLGRDLLEVDWAATPLGPLESWPQSLKSVVQVLLTSRFSMWMAWGPELTFFANEKYVRDTLGSKYPWALGKPASIVWSEIWPEIGPRIETVMRTGVASWEESLLLFLERSGYREETYHTFSYSPLTDEHRQIVGMLCVVSEETERVVGEQRMAILRDVGGALTAARTEDEVFATVEQQLGSGLGVLPFSLVYVFDDDGSARLAAAAGVRRSDSVALEHVPAAGGSWPLDSVGGRPVVVNGLAERFGDVPAGGWSEPAHTALLLPLLAQPGERPYGVFIAGLNPFRLLDAAYEGFLLLLTSQIGASIGNARAYEAERRRAESLAELDRAKTAFFTNISHEFRTPLTLILAPAEDALTDREHALPDPQRERLELVRRNALRLRRLVNDLLEFSRIESGGLVADPEPTDLAALTRDIGTSFAGAVESAGLGFRVEVEELGRPVLVDREMWEKIVLNLLSNALKHTLEGEIAVLLRPSEERVELRVRDTGVGIPAGEMPNLFQRFHRVRSSGGRSHEGTGIGLALVKELVALHGGEVAAESELGVGSTFVVWLPFGQAGTRAAPDGKPISAGLEPYLVEASRWLETDGVSGDGIDQAASGAVMVVDDNAEMRRLLVRVLAPHYRVTECADGLEALDAALREPPDVVLTDVMMPRLDGFGLLRGLRADLRTAATPVIFISARAGEESSVEGFEAGVDDYLVKPFSSAELIARVRSHVHRARLQRDEREAREHAELLERIAFRMSGASTGAAVARAAVEELTANGIAYGAILTRQGDEMLGLLASAGLHPDSERESRLFPVSDGGAVADAVLENRLVAVGTAAEYDARYPVAAARRRRDRLETLVAAPLRSPGGEIVGALWVASPEQHWLTERRRSLVQGVAEQVGTALERTRLDEALLEREQAAVLLARLTEVLEPLTAPADRAEAAVRLFSSEVGDCAWIHLWRDGSLRRLAASGGATRQLTLAAAEVAQAAVAFDETRSVTLGDGTSLLAVPLRARGDTIGALCVSRGADAGSFDRTRVHDLADRLAISLDNALLYERERNVSHRLQLGLLGEGLPPLPEIEAVPAYRPGGASLEVGGDWYDAFALPDGKIALVVGDVVGHGLDAAITMGQLRGAVRALAPLGGPAELLGRLDEFAGMIPGADSATLAYAELEPASGRLRYACAGHPPPFVVRAGGGGEFLWGGRSAPVASFLPGNRLEAEELLEPGDTLGLYTDGLVERRGQALDSRFDRLLAAAATAAGAGLDRLSEAILGEMLRDDTDDDACLMVVRAAEPAFSITIRSDASQLAPLRGALREWLEAIGVQDGDRHELLLAVGEAAANAVEHAYRGIDGGDVRVDARLACGDEVTVRVSDDGRWLSRPSQPERGRGTAVMKAVVDQVEVTPGSSGTRVELRKRVRIGAP